MLEKSQTAVPGIGIWCTESENEDFLVTSVDGYVIIGIHKIDGSDPGISREKSLNAFHTLHREVGNL